MSPASPSLAGAGHRLRRLDAIACPHRDRPGAYLVSRLDPCCRARRAAEPSATQEEALNRRPSSALTVLSLSTQDLLLFPSGGSVLQRSRQRRNRGLEAGGPMHLARYANTREHRALRLRRAIGGVTHEFVCVVALVLLRLCPQLRAHARTGLVADECREPSTTNA